MSPFYLVYSKSWNLLVEIKYKEFWVVKQCNMNMDALREQMKLQLNKLQEIRNDAYESLWIYKDETKVFNDKMILGKHFVFGQKMLE